MKKPDKPQYNLTEEEIKRLYVIARKLSRKYVFGYYDKDDIVQEAVYFALKALPDYDGERPIFNFLYTHMVNRLINLIRDKKERIVPPCELCHEGKFCTKDTPCKKYIAWFRRNADKKSIVSPKSIDGHNIYEREENLDEKLTIQELRKYVEGKLTVGERKLFLMYLDGVKLKKNDFLFLKNVIGKILEGYDAKS